MFARFVDLRREPDFSAKSDFHKLVDELKKLGKRRNDLVHSKYASWTNVHGAAGLIRQNSKLRASKGSREEDEEELLPEGLNADIECLFTTLRALEPFRLKIIDWLYPVE
jgi:hypothetical protein